MFNGSDSLRFTTSLSEGQVRDAVERALSRLGRARVSDRGDRVDISGKKHSDFASEVKIDGRLMAGRRENEWELEIDYSVTPTGMCWVIAVVGFLLCLVGPLVFIMPFGAKSKVAGAVSSALRDVEREVEDDRRDRRDKRAPRD